MLYFAMNSQQVEEFFSIITQKTGPIELDYTNHYTLLVAVVLSARMTDKGVNKATKELFKIVSTPQDMLKLGETALKEHIKTIGLYKTKAKHIIVLSALLIDKFASKVPETLEELESLPAAGRKTEYTMTIL